MSDIVCAPAVGACTGSLDTASVIAEIRVDRTQFALGLER